MTDEEDEVNVAQWHPCPGQGIVYGTKRGKVRSFIKATTEGELCSNIVNVPKKAL